MSFFSSGMVCLELWKPWKEGGRLGKESRFVQGARSLRRRHQIWQEGKGHTQLLFMPLITIVHCATAPEHFPNSGTCPETVMLYTHAQSSQGPAAAALL